MTGRIVAAVAVLAAGSVGEASPPSAATVLADVQHFYANASHLKAGFRLLTTMAAFGTTKTSTGVLWVGKPELFRLDFVEPTGTAVTKTFAFDGTTQWMVEHDNKLIIKNGIGGVYRVVFSFWTGGNLAAQYNVARDRSGKYATGGSYVLALTPKHSSPLYKELLLVVDPADSHVEASIVIDSHDNTNELDFTDLDPVSTVKPSWFQVDPASFPLYKLVE